MYSFFRKLRLAKMDVMNMTVIKLLAFLGLVAYMCYFFRRVSLFLAKNVPAASIYFSSAAFLFLLVIFLLLFGCFQAALIAFCNGIIFMGFYIGRCKLK